MMSKELRCTDCNVLLSTDESLVDFYQEWEGVIPKIACKPCADRVNAEVAGKASFEKPTEDKL